MESLNDTLSGIDDGIGNESVIADTTESAFFIEPPDIPELAPCISFALKSDIKILSSWKYWLTGVASIVLGLFGFLGNFFAIAVLCSPKMKSAFNLLLVTLFVFDTIFLACNIGESLSAIGVDHDHLSTVKPLADVMAHVSMCASVLMIVSLTFERHFAICNPHKYRIHLRTVSRWRHLAMYIAPVTVCSLFFNIPMFINLQKRWMTNALYVKINLYLRAFHPLTTTGLAPVAILIVLNVRICRGISILHQRRTSRNRKELNMAYVAIIIVTLFVVTNLPRILAGAHEVTNTHLIIHCIENKVLYVPSMDFYKLDFIARMLMVLNSSVNFVVYCSVSTPFKRTFYGLVSPVLPSCLRRRQGRRGGGDEDCLSSGDMATFAGLATNTITTAGNVNNNANGGANGVVVVVVMAESEAGIAKEGEQKEEEGPIQKVSESSEENCAILEEGAAAADDCLTSAKCTLSSSSSKAMAGGDGSCCCCCCCDVREVEGPKTQEALSVQVFVNGGTTTIAKTHETTTTKQSMEEKNHNNDVDDDATANIATTVSVGVPDLLRNVGEFPETFL